MSALLLLRRTLALRSHLRPLPLRAHPRPERAKSPCHSAPPAGTARCSRLILLLPVLLAAILLAPAARAQEPAAERDFPSVHRAARAELVTALVDLAAWSGNKELFAERDRLYRAIIGLDPDNAAARKGLRYSRKSDGSWQEPAPRESKNRNQKALVELAERRRAAVEPFRTTMLAALEEFSADSAARAEIHAEILEGDPDDAAVRAARGEAKSGDDWVLIETVKGEAQRKEIAALAQEALADAGAPHPIPLSEVEKKLGLKFTQAMATHDVRVLGTGKAPECEQAARNCQAAGRFLRALMGIETLHQEGFTVYMMAGDKEGAVFVANLPGLDADFRKQLEGCTGAFIVGQPIVAYWDRDLAHRVDGTSRQTLGDFLGRTYGLGLDQGWAWEGLGLYLNHALCGTRLTWFAQMPNATTAQKALFKKLQGPDADWFAEALLVLEQDSRPRFDATLERGVDKMTVEDVLCAHALAAWLLEGRPGDLPAILQQIGGGKHSTADAFRAVLHMEPSQVGERLRRWLSERR